MRQNRAWAKADQRVVFPYDSNRFKGVTLFGAIGTGLSEPFFMLAERTDAQEYERFLQHLVVFIKPQMEGAPKPRLVIDGHPAHLTVSNRALMEQHFEITQLPASSCEFNSIEWLWSLVKKKFRSTITPLVGQIKT